MIDRKFFLSLAVCFLILAVYPYYMKMITPQGALDPNATEQVVSENAAVLDEAPLPQVEQAVRASLENEESYTLQNDTLQINFSNIGGSITEISLPQFQKKENGGNVLILSNAYGTKTAGLVLEGNLDLKEYVFNVQAQTDERIVFHATVGSYEVTKSFEFLEDYLFGVQVDLKNVGQAAASSQYELYADADSSAVGRYDDRFRKVTIYQDGNVKSAHFNKVEKKGFLLEGPSSWASMQKKYFALFVKSEGPLEHIRAKADKKDELRTIYKTQARTLLPGEMVSDQYILYAGPTEYKRIRDLGYDFQKIMTGGFWGTFRLLLLNLLGWCYNLVNNYGFAIILLTIGIKVVLTPLTHKSMHSMRRMQELQPKLKVLQDKHKNEPQKLNKEVMELYKKHKVNPLGGCMPMLLQMPIFIALYQVLSESVELRGAPFAWWIQDLSEPDRLFGLPFTVPFLNIDSVNLLPLLMIVSMVLQQKLTPAAGQTAEQRRIMMFMMLFMGLLFYNLPSGLMLYWFFSNILAIAHQLYTYRKPTVISEA